MNQTTKRFPRTLTEAFGPYTSDHIDEPSPRVYMTVAEWVFYIITLIAICVTLWVI